MVQCSFVITLAMMIATVIVQPQFEMYNAVYSVLVLLMALWCAILLSASVLQV